MSLVDVIFVQRSFNFSVKSEKTGRAVRSTVSKNQIQWKTKPTWSIVPTEMNLHNPDGSIRVVNGAIVKHGDKIVKKFVSYELAQKYVDSRPNN